MPATLRESSPPAQFSERDREKVLQQLHRLLESSLFNQSRRYPALLRYIVEETLEGRGHLLKERVMGIEVFKRAPDYDNAIDPIVRVTIAEIRKRVAQYYHNEAHDFEMRIELLPGRYAPEFRPCRSAVPRRADEPLLPCEDDPVRSLTRAIEAAGSNGVEAYERDSRVVEAKIFLPSETPGEAMKGGAAWKKIWPAKQRIGLVRPRLWLGGLVLLAVGILAGSLYGPTKLTPLDQLWAPLLMSKRQVVFCVPTEVGKHHGSLSSTVEGSPGGASSTDLAPISYSATETFLEHESQGESVVFSDMLATVKMAEFIGLRHGDLKIRLNRSTSLDDLRQGPTVLVGGLDNQWTLRSIASLRYRFRGDGQEGYWISDARDPGSQRWSLDLKQPYLAVTRDYAIIARVSNEQTGQPQMIVAGIGMSGTAAAGEFLVDPEQAEKLRARVGAGFAKRDFEAVLSTDVVNGVAGSPKILAVEVW